ncbi:Homoserine O-acetyltransferase [Mycobacteroides abscessus subsp. abscessus]|nr:Homoserine O-acetyltransferase [Mycobacteroides abscessus subsp. abscessus]
MIDDVTIAVQSWGELSPRRDNVVFVCHALTADSHVVGPAGPDHITGGWWSPGVHDSPRSRCATR